MGRPFTSSAPNKIPEPGLAGPPCAPRTNRVVRSSTHGGASGVGHTLQPLETCPMDAPDPVCFRCSKPITPGTAAQIGGHPVHMRCLAQDTRRDSIEQQDRAGLARLWARAAMGRAQEADREGPRVPDRVSGLRAAPGEPPRRPLPGRPARARGLLARRAEAGRRAAAGVARSTHRHCSSVSIASWRGTRGARSAGTAWRRSSRFPGGWSTPRCASWSTVARCGRRSAPVSCASASPRSSATGRAAERVEVRAGQHRTPIHSMGSAGARGRTQAYRRN